MSKSVFYQLTIEEIVEKVKKAFPNDDCDRILAAYHFAERAHEHQRRMSGEPYIVHPLFVASILAETMLDASTVIAGLLHDTVEDCVDVSLDLIRENFGEEVAMLVDGVTKLGKLDYQDKEERQAESLRKMIIAMGKDIRVIIIKLADRLHNLLTLSFQPKEKQVRIARETLDIYAPIAHRLGVHAIKQELEDISLRYIDPEAYRDIANKIGLKKTEREEQIKQIIKILTEKLNDAGIKNFEIAGRPKHLYSVYRKMVLQNKDFEQIYDLIAVRIMVNTVKECYDALGVVHQIFNCMPGRFKDYISTPKKNMYSSLHTTLNGGRLVPIPFEVQIRTYEMHRLAEFGIAAHWNYKDGGSDKKLDDKLQWLRQIIDWQDDTKDPREFIDALRTDLFSDEVFLFTPKGDIISMQKGVTPIDFAYRVHSGVGNSCVGAKVNGVMVPLNTKLKTGDIVDIITSKSSKGPSLDWLKIAITPQAKTKIRQFFKKELRGENIKTGREMLEHEAKRHGVKLSDYTKPEYYNNIVQKHQLIDLDGMYNAVGCGTLSAVFVFGHLIDEYNKQGKQSDKSEIPVFEPKAVQKPSGKPTQGVFVEGGTGMFVKFAHCCNPVPGDEIIGYITRGHYISIHKTDCTNVASFEMDRLVSVSWADDEDNEFSANIQIIASDHKGLLNEITTFIANLGVEITALNISVNKNKTCSIYITINVKSASQIEGVLKKIKNRSDVLDAFRTARRS